MHADDPVKYVIICPHVSEGDHEQKNTVKSAFPVPRARGHRYGQKMSPRVPVSPKWIDGTRFHSSLSIRASPYVF